MPEKKKCNAKVEVYSRVCGFFRPVQQFNIGKKEEYHERKNFKINSNIMREKDKN